MAWTAPATWTTAEVVTASKMNAQVRDNFLETAVAKVTTAGDMTYATAANTLARLGIGAAGTHLVGNGTLPIWRPVGFDENFSGGTLSMSTASTGFVRTMGITPEDLPDVTLTTGTTALIMVSCVYVQNDTAGGTCTIAFSVTGATSVGAGDGNAGALHESGSANDAGNVTGIEIFSGLTAGSNNFNMVAKVSTGNGTFVRPRILVIPFS